MDKKPPGANPIPEELLRQIEESEADIAAGRTSPLRPLLARMHRDALARIRERESNTARRRGLAKPA